MPTTNIRTKRSKGMAIILTTLSVSVTLPLVGLGFDVGTLYLVKSKLVSAADAAALGGARALAQGTTPADQRTNATSTAQNFFGANFPAGYWNTTGASASVNVDDTSTPNYRVVSVTATVQAPLYFLRVFNQTSSTINVTSKAGRRDVLLMLVLDRSSSMNGVVAGTGQTACALMKGDAAAFVDYFAPGRDQLGLVVFGSSAFVYPPTTSFMSADANGNSVPSLIGQITCGANTSSAEAIQAAYSQLKTVNNSKRMNVIVFMTDGRPNGVTENFTSMAIGGCSTDKAGDPLTGVLAQWAGGALPTGNTAGLMNDSTNSLLNTNEGPIPAGGGCHFPANLTNVRKDISGMPNTDIYGDSLVGPYSQQNTAWPYNGVSPSLVGVSSPQDIVVASANAVDNAATTVRTDATLTPYIYSIALEGNGPVNDQPDELLLRKMANDPTLAGDSGIGATFYQNQINQPHGYFAVAPNASQLAVAFNTIATQISVRLAQ